MKNTIAILLFLFSQTAFSQKERIQISHKPAKKRIDITVAGKPFTSYIYSDSLVKKPFLYPIFTVHGQKITRSYPLEKNAGERVDETAQAGLGFGFGKVNGINFWDYSYLTIDALRKTRGQIRHTKILKIKNGDKAAGLEVAAQWEMPDRTAILFQNTKYVFRDSANIRTIDVVITLSALLDKAFFEDSQDGLLALRLAKELEMADTAAWVRTDLSGKINTTPSLNPSASAIYLNSEGNKNSEADTRKAKWVKVSGKIKNEAVTVAIFDHPDNVGFPAFWNVKKSGSLAANPLGSRIYTNKADFMDLEIPSGNAAIFKYRIYMQSRTVPTDGQIKAEFEKFSKLK
ncbi:MAG: PmoA family protein [Verrucomicrobia bacterium]|nr:PmoA family protein [Cytophagales bacterium]